MKTVVAESMPSSPAAPLTPSSVVLVASSLLLIALVVSQFIPSKHNKAFLRLDGPPNASWLLGGFNLMVVLMLFVQIMLTFGDNAVAAGSWGAVLDNEAMSLTTAWTKQFGGAYRFGGFFSVSQVHPLRLLWKQY